MKKRFAETTVYQNGTYFDGSMGYGQPMIYSVGNYGFFGDVDLIDAIKAVQNTVGEEF